ncbi:cilia- and flagella-associated protein 144-like [Lycorma delicatula]|uniref:cilia- and flagella-associated protein 144-like n=1 Tax=Lycorma delicatula TaxID=130591 RepID=UPI003F511B79
MHATILLHRQLTEMYERERKYLKPYMDFRPNLKATFVTGKFYSHYDSRITEPKEVYIDMLTQYQEKTPKEKLPYPETTNQEYGWYTDPLMDKDYSDRRMQHGRKIHPHTQTETIIKMCVTKR